jgi:hypothetical protein
VKRHKEKSKERWFPMNIESLRNQVKALGSLPAVKAPVVGPTVVCLLDEPAPAGAGVVIRCKSPETKDALSKGVAGGVLCDVGAGR